MSQFPKRASEVFDAVLELPKEQRAAYLDAACAGDTPLRQRVEDLLRAYEAAGTFMETPAPGPLPKVADLTPMDQLTERIGRYRLLQQIGEGGCGVVYLAEQEEPVRRRLALKVIKLGMDTRSVIARFEAERQALALMDHPNIAKVFDAGATETGRPYFVMELVKGAPITRYCDDNGLDTEQRLRLFIQVCQAIQHAHQKGVIHRDLKPSNILVSQQDGKAVPKVIDFGIAKATGDQRLTDKTLFTACEQFIGTPAYMSPEQAGFGQLDIDTRTDIYSLGVLLYELLTGKTPFEAKRLINAGLDETRRILQEEEPLTPSTRLRTLEAAEQTAAAHCRQTEPPKLFHLIRGDLDWIVMKALEKDRLRRYETANGLAMDIERHLNSEPVVARPASEAYRFQRWARRNKLLFSAIGAVALALILGIIVSTLEAVRARRAEQQQSRLRAMAESTQRALNFSDASRFDQAHDGADAVPYLSRILSAEPDDKPALTQLAMLLTYHSWMIPTISMKHAGWVLYARFSPDGKRVMTISIDSNSAATMRVWDAQTGQPLTVPLKLDAAVDSAEFSQDGKRVVTGSTNFTARVWDAQTGQPLTGPLKHGAPVDSAEFSPDGKLIVTASEDFTARVWDAQTGQPLTIPLKHGARVTSAEFSPDSTRIVTAAADSTARVWNAQTGQPLTVPLKHGAAVESAKFSPDGKLIVTISDDFTARVWDAQSGQPQTIPLKHGARVTSAEFSPDGMRVVTASADSTARVWDARSGWPLTKPLQHFRQVNFAQFSPDGRHIVTASTDYSARVWDAQTGEPLSDPLEHPGSVWTAQFSPDGLRIVTGSADGTAQVWDIVTAPALSEVLKHASWVHSAQFSPDGKFVVTASYDHTARVWDAQTSQPLGQPLIHGGPVESAEFSPDGKRIVTASDDHTAREWDAQTGQPVSEPLKHPGAVGTAQFSPDGQRIVTASGDSVRVWNAQSGQPITGPLKHEDNVQSVQFSPDGRRIVTAASDKTARVWDAQTGQLLIQCMKHAEPVACARFSPDGRRIVTVSADRTARIWDAETGQPLAVPLKHTDYVLDGQFSPDARLVVTASRDGSARVWDAETGHPLTEPLSHEASVEFAQFSPDGTRIVTASTDSTARLWDVETGQPLVGLLRHGDKVFTARFSPDGKRVVTASRDHTARLLDVGFAPSHCPDWLLQLAEALSGKRLNQQGILELTNLDRAKTIAQIRQYLKNQPDSGDGVMWGRWLLADRSTRTISPFSSITVPQYIQNRINESTAESLAEVEQLAYGDVELWQRILAARATFERTNRPAVLPSP